MIFGSELKLSKVQAAESGCLRIVHGVTIRVDTVRSCQISQFLNIEPLLIGIERSQLSWFGHVSRLSQERLPRKVCESQLRLQMWSKKSAISLYVSIVTP